MTQNNNNDKYLTFLTEHTNVVADIHLHDGAAGGGAHWALGAGELDLPEFAATVIDASYSGYLTLETLGWEDTRSSYGVATSALAAARYPSNQDHQSRYLRPVARVETSP